MDDQPHPNAEVTDSSACDPESLSHASGIFSHSQQFTVTGGIFTHVTNKNYAALSLPSDFRMIPMGDIDLLHEIRLDEYTSVAYCQRQRACVRRMHSAKAIIAGRKKSRVTVAMYQGNDAEEEWRQDMETYIHPNIIQICGAASSNGIHAAIFNGDLIPLRNFLDSYRESHFTTVYIYACCNSDFSTVRDYIDSAFQQSVTSADCTRWIRRSTGRLCTELTTASDYMWLDWQSPELPALSPKYRWNASAETITSIIDSLTLEQYHRICDWNLAQRQHFDICASTTVNFGTVFCYNGDRLEDSVEIAFLPSAEAVLGNWIISEGGTGEIMPNGWTRFPSGDVINNTLYLTLNISPSWHTWLSQANHIFHHLHITSNFEDYVHSDGGDSDADVDSDCNSPCTEDYESEYPPTSACDDFDLDTDAGSSHSQETVHDPLSRHNQPEHQEKLNWKDHNASESTVEEDLVAEEIPVLSPTFRIVLCIQLMLILFLALSELHNCVWLI
ncbi:hypothetical protein MSAN_01303100 [Mycena sanguinolenta]|uniref:Uncharacterized protein n=1 Tax=Mycena sanguinolenta TaxID=230812 RepID=A0A8H6Y9X2_9AGAR|nr:hypothetical protein MSAN_01303100 [Mycena sanguinolenta]